MKQAALILVLLAHLAARTVAQEAYSGVSLGATVTGQFAASSIFTQAAVAEPVATAGFRTVLYPTIKFSDRWTITGAWQAYSRPYFFDSFTNTNRGATGNLLQASLNYARVSPKGSFVVSAGELSTAFGSFLLRYDDAENPLANLPQAYGYYYAPVSSLPVAGAQIDATRQARRARSVRQLLASQSAQHLRA